MKDEKVSETLAVDFLIVDDDAPVRESLVRFLEDEDYSICACESGEEALEFLESGGIPKAALIDVRLGGIQGDELLERALSLAPDVNYRIFTGSVDFTLSESLIRAGVKREDVMLKPLQDLDVLNSLIN